MHPHGSGPASQLLHVFCSKWIYLVPLLSNVDLPKNAKSFSVKRVLMTRLLMGQPAMWVREDRWQTRRLAARGESTLSSTCPCCHKEQTPFPGARYLYYSLTSILHRGTTSMVHIMFLLLKVKNNTIQWEGAPSTLFAILHVLKSITV